MKSILSLVVLTCLAAFMQAQTISVHVSVPQVNCENNFTFNAAFLTVSFRGTTNSPYPTTYTWHMGDPAGTTLNGQNVTFTYPAAGSYNVTLVTVDSLNCQWTRTTEIYTAATCDVNGFVYMGIHPVDHGWIDLIKLDSNNNMTIVQGKEIGDSVGSYHFGVVSPGSYYLKSRLLPSSSRYGHFMPTYYDSSLTWENAQLIVLGQAQNPYIIHLVECTPEAPGNGNIQGFISQGLKVSNSATGVPGVEVMFLDPNSNPLGYTITDTTGNFSFANIAYGTYIIKPEKTGVASTGAQKTVDNGHSTVYLPFTLSNGQILYGINVNLPSDFTYIGDIFPNPASGTVVKLKVNCLKGMNVELSLCNTLGQTMAQSETMTEPGANILEISIAGLKEGLYFLKVESPGDKAVIRRLTIIGGSW
jgi:PKD repeat protein